MARQREATARANRHAFYLMGGFVIASLLLALLLGFVTSWSFILPVREAQGFLGRVAKGDFSTTVTVDNRDEFGALAARMNNMSAELHRLYEEQRGGRPPARDAQHPARAGEPGQVRVPRQHEPRAPHADERHPRLHRDDPRRHLRRRAPGGARPDPGRPDLRAAAAPADQRRPRPLQDRGGPDGALPDRLLRAGGGGDRAHLPPLARRGKGPRVHRGGAARRARSPTATASASPSA